MNILICEDNPLAVKTVSVVLKREGFNTESARDGNEAMDMMRINDYDLFVEAIHLPNISGLELVKYLRSDLGKNTPVLVLTAFSNPQMQMQAKQLGINGYIVKPFNPSDLVSKIRSLV